MGIVADEIAFSLENLGTEPGATVARVREAAELCGVKDLLSEKLTELSSGQNLGRVDDICFDENSAVITHIILYGRPRLFGLLGREEDTMIPWADIRQIGQDVLLVHTQAVKRTPRRHFFKFE